jgi:hypothetical protein
MNLNVSFASDFWAIAFEAVWLAVGAEFATFELKLNEQTTEKAAQII